MNKKWFIELAKSKNYPSNELFLFEQAIDLAETSLKDQKRLSGGSFFEHNLRTGKILIDNSSSYEIVIAGLLHGLISPEQKSEIKSKFGAEVLSLIEGVEEIEQLKHQNKQLEAEAIRKLMMVTSKDIRVMIVKLANKLDNLRTMDKAISEPEQKRIAQEVLEVYAPLAYRLGMDKLKVKLEDAAFRVLNPKIYREIEDFLKESSNEREKDIVRAIELIKNLIDNKVQIVSIKGRPKHIYSIYKKNTDRKVPLRELYDLLGIRILVPEIKDCYSLLGILHEKLEPISDKLKDYIANPKPNFYRSIHTALKLPNGKVIEVQIRTPEMDEYAEEGVAAHWKYKKMSSEAGFEKKIGWLKEILKLQKDETSKDFLEMAKIDVFGDNIYCYTPKGDIKELPKNSSVLDFAYLVHEEVGNHAVGGRINGKFVPLREEISHGDVIEILTNKNQRPRRSWLKIVKSGSAKQKIRKALKEFETLPALHYRKFKPLESSETGTLVVSTKFPQASCLLAKCCNPLPDDEIVGIVTKRRVVSVHRSDCKSALKEEDRWIPVNWKNEFGQKIRFYAEAGERSGLLADLLHTIASAGFEVKEAKAKLIDMEKAECSFAVIPKDLDHLKELVKRIKKVRGVKRIWFE